MPRDAGARPVLDDRALILLAEVPPKLSKPARPDQLKPLSSRSTAQLAAAKKLTREQRYTEAAFELEKAFRFDPAHPEIELALARLHWQAGNADRAKVYAERASRTNPDLAGAHYLIGRCAESAGDPASAVTAFRTALACSDLETDPQLTVLVRYHLAGTLAKERYSAAALELYDTLAGQISALDKSQIDDFEAAALVQAGAARLGVERAAVLEALHRFGEAAESLGPAIAETPRDAQLRLRQARLLLRAKKPDEALSALRTIESDNEEVLSALSEAHSQAGHPEGLVDDLRAKLAVKTESARLAIAVGESLRNLNRAAEAERELSAFLDRNPDVVSVRDKLIAMLAAEKKWPDLIRIAADGYRTGRRNQEQLEQALRGLSKTPEAVSALPAATPTDDPYALFVTGILLAEAGRSEGAVEFFERSRRAAPEFIEPRIALATLYLREYRYDDALRTAGRRDKDTPEDARLERLLGQSYERLDDFERAVRHFKAAIQLDRSDVDSAFRLALVYRQTGDMRMAQRELGFVLERDPSQERARELLAMMYVDERKMDVAAEQLEELRRRAQSTATRTRADALLNLVQTRDPETYRRNLREATERGEADAITWLALADSFTEFEQEEAKKCCLKALELDPNNEEAAIGLAFAQQRLVEYESAITSLEALLRKRPNRHAWRIGWNESGWRLGLLESYLVVQDHEAVLRVAGNYEDSTELEEQVRNRYRGFVLEALRRLGREEEGIRRLESWVSSASEPRVWELRLAREYLRQKRFDDALALFTELLEANPSDNSALANMVEALQEAGKHERAAQFLLERLMVDPESDDLLGALTGAVARAERYADGLDVVRNKLLVTRDRERFQDASISLLSLSGDHSAASDLAESLLDEVIATLRAIHGQGPARPMGPQAEDGDWARRIRSPNEPFSRQSLEERLVRLRGHLSEQLMAAKAFREAEMRLTEWLEESPDPRSRAAYLLALTSCYREQGNEQQAATTQELVLALVPDHVGLNNDVAYGWIDRGMHLDRAERMIRYALSRQPRQTAYLDTFGWLLYKKGDFAAATKWLSRANRSGPEQDPVILDHLADAVWRLGNSNDALAHWTAALEIVRGRPEEALNADERRVLNTTQRKIDDVKAGNKPEVAALAPTPGSSSD